MHVLAIQNLTSLSINNFTLLVVNLIVLQEVLSDTEVVGLDLLLSSFNELRYCLMLYLFSFRNLQSIIDTHNSF